LLNAKLFRDVLIKYPALILAGGIGAAYVLLAVPALVVAPYFIPVGAAGLLTVAGLGLLGARKIRKKGSELAFRATYFLLARPHPSEEARQKAREDALVQAPLPRWSRAWALLATAGGGDPKGGLSHYIPVAGPIFKANARSALTKSRMRRVLRDVLQEEADPKGLKKMDATISFLTLTEGLLGAAGQTLLISGGVLFVAGSTFAALEYSEPGELGNYALVATASGIAGSALASAGITALVGRKLSKSLMPVLPPLAYGIIPPAEDEEEEEGE